jgi:hypothetical protein
MGGVPGGPGGNGPDGWHFPEPEPAGKPPRRNTRKLALGAGIGTVAIAGLVTVLVLTQSGASANAGHDTVAGPAGSAAATVKPTTPKPTPSGFQPTATTPAGAAQQLAEVFLTAWQSGNFKQAASYTDDPATAQTVLSAFGSKLNLSGLQLKAQSATAAGLVGFSVSASVSTGAPGSTGALSGTWAYTSHLTAYSKNGGWWVQWNPGLVAPGLSDTVHPVAISDEPNAAKVTDSAGNDLAASSQTALQDISTDVKQNVKTPQGTPGLQVVYESSSGAIAPGLSDVLTKPVGTGVVKTTIDPTMEALATTAVDQLPRSSMVVLRPSTGAILAVANNKQPYDIALAGTLAPGSSMKVVTTTGLFVNGLLPQGMNTQVGCPLVEDVQGVKIHNSTTSANSLSGTEDFEPNNTPFSTDFAQSCNNAFTQWWQKMAGGKLASAASTYYGLNQSWDLGLGSKSTYFSMPSDQSGSELAEELYGQGVIEANPLSMASIAATVDTGTFHQPYLVDGVTDKTTATPLPSSVKSSLYSMMREVITSGTAEAVGFGPGVYGKTGTAEAAANKDNNPNGWMIVFDPSKDLAVASVVVDSNFGASTAGPEAKYVLDHS